MRVSQSFSARLTRNVILVSSCLFIAASLVVFFFSHVLIGEEAAKNASNTLQANIIELEKTLSEVESSTISLAWLIKEHQRDKEFLYHITQKMVSENENIVGSAIAFRPDFFPSETYFSPYSYKDATTGEVISKQLGSDKYDYFSMEWYKVSQESKQSHWSEPYFDEGGGQQVMCTFSFPILDETGSVMAIFTADINLQKLTDRFKVRKPYENAYMIILSRQGTFICHDNPDYILKKDYRMLAEEWKQDKLREIGDAMLRGDSGMTPFNLKHDRAFSIYGPMANGWSATIICQYKDVFARTMRMNIIIFLVSALGLFLLFIFCFITIRRLTQPITEFSVAALNMAKGNFQARLPEIQSKDEMMLLHNSFEYMQKSIANYISELKSTMAKNERFENELNIARNIQLAMVPKNFETVCSEQLDLYAFLQPAKEVGGDLYDFFIMDGKLYFALGDVSGKGVPAALFMAITRASFRFIAKFKIPMEQVVGRINDMVCEGNESGMFVTLFAACIDLNTGEMHYCNAGHNPIVIVNPDGEARFLRAKPNIAVGLFEGFPYAQEEITVEKGSRLIVYTDGVTEAENIEQELFGDDRLLAYCNAIDPNATSKEVVDNLSVEMKKFTLNAEQNDDITMMSFQLK